MKIELEYVSFLDLPETENNSVIQVDANARIKDVLAELGLSSKNIKHIKPFINEEETSLNSSLEEGDHLFLYLPAGGG